VTDNTDTLRPATLDEYCGQERLKRRLSIRVAAALAENRPLDHILLCGPPGAGKTSLAEIISAMTGDPLVCLTMPVTEQVLARVVATHAGVLFLDELHRLPTKRQELLLPLLEFGQLHRTSGQVVENGFLTVVGATTERERIIPPLYDRFAYAPTYEPYAPQELAAIAASMCDKAGIELAPETLDAIGEAAGGVPRNVRKLILAARDLLATFEGEPTVGDILELCGTAADGLTESHDEYLMALHSLGGTAGVSRLASVLRLHESVCMDLERLLVKHGLVDYGGRGRELTPKGLARASRLARAA
jgi:holliday junction DNA helicase RuvB